ncbi:MAG: hypothetical protein J1E83_00020 [Lachnospiraceae bacterium]|nr:hypothetical protein [Lachnospiraceae bacterium]
MLTEKTDNMEPSMYPMNINVMNEIQKCPEILNALTRSNLDDIVLAWTGMFLHSVYHIFKDLRREGNKNWDNSILFCGLSSQAMQLDWIKYSVCCGQYDLALRELRNVLESAFLFYRGDFDRNFRDYSLEKKAEELEKLKKQEKYGKPIFENSGYANWEQAYKLYGELCAYTHTAISLENAKKLFEDFNGWSEPVFDKERILKCIYYIQEVLALECNLMENILKDVYGIENPEYASIFKSK